MLPIVAIMANSTSLGGAAATSTPTVASTASGTCSGSNTGQSAALRVSWTITNPAPTQYAARLYENGILKQTSDTAASMSWDKIVSGYVEDGPRSPFTADWTYRVDVVDKSNGRVVSSKTSATWERTYGLCSSGGGL